jgi:hypothetical protein
MSRVVDLDAAREERAKKRSESGWEPPEVRFAGETFVLPAELPYDFIRALEANDAEQAMRVLLDGDHGRFTDLKPSVDDLHDLAVLAARAYTAAADEVPTEEPRANPKPRRRPAKEA